MSDPEDVPAKRPIDPPREYGEAPSLLERLNREIRNHKCTLHMDGRNRYPDGLVAEAAARIAELEARQKHSDDEWSDQENELIQAEEQSRADAARIAEQGAEIERLRAALLFYVDADNWNLRGPLDGNSGNFTGWRTAARALNPNDGE